MRQNLVLVLGLALTFTQLASAPSQAAEAPAAPSQRLLGNGLAQHDFLYAGESKNRRVFIVRKGQVVWPYGITNSPACSSRGVCRTETRL